MIGKLLILCTGNSCRSQMAEAVLKSLDPSLDVYSAGTRPAGGVHPLAIRAMQEIGIDLSTATTKGVDAFLDGEFEYVITVCDQAKEHCPVFTGKVQHRIHIGFDDPSASGGTEEEMLSEFRRIRDEIRSSFHALYISELKGR